MHFEQLVETSRRISETSKRLEKIALLAALLKRLHGEEVDIAAAYLSGRTRQGKIGVGYSVLGNSASESAAQSTLNIMDVDRALAEVSKIQGTGSERRRVDCLRALFSRATVVEQE